MTLRERFESKVEISPDGCWEWTGYRSDLGYGRMQFRGASRPAHRIAYLLFVGEVPDGLELDHLCRNRGCVNPEHLEAVTHQENCRRAMHIRTKCRHGHDLAFIKDGSRRRCPTCAANCKREYRIRMGQQRMVAC